MQRISVIFLILMLLTACGKEVKTVDARIYYIDHELLALIGVPVAVEGENISERAQNVLNKLVDGQDFNRKIKRQIPKTYGLMTVSMEGSCAVVNLSEEFVRRHEDGRIAERLTVYQIVNSLTSLDGINSVRFTINSKTNRNFKGFLDMRETFVHKAHVL